MKREVVFDDVTAIGRVGECQSELLRIAFRLLQPSLGRFRVRLRLHRGNRKALCQPQEVIDSPGSTAPYLVSNEDNPTRGILLVTLIVIFACHQPVCPTCGFELELNEGGPGIGFVH
jgi:hypothetical protein